ncbi:MAG: hypothetical protein V1740_00840 [Candidatus Woesearchaeota archaeon]
MEEEQTGDREEHEDKGERDEEQDLEQRVDQNPTKGSESQEPRIELYDVGRVITGPFRQGYDFIASELAGKYITDPEALERIREFHRTRGNISQDDFNLLNYAWVEAIKAGELEVDPSEIVYDDVAPRFNLVRGQGNLVYLLTSGSIELIELLIGNTCQYDGLLVGEEIGDKNDPETFARVPALLDRDIKAFYDDKPSVLYAAYQGFQSAGVNPSLYLVDRHNKVNQANIDDLVSKGVVPIYSFTEIAD